LHHSRRLRSRRSGKTLGKSQRTKGHDFERKVARILRSIWPDAKRGFQTRGGTAEAPDIEGTPYWIECKKGKRTNIKAAMRQAAGQNLPPVAITQDDRQDVLVTMRLADWMALFPPSNGEEE